MIHGQRVYLRQAHADDADVIYSWMNSVVQDISGQAALSGTMVSTPDQIKEDIISSSRKTLIIVTDAGQSIGLVEWQWIGNQKVLTADIGVSVGLPELWSLGYGGDAIETLIAYLFLQENAHRVQFSVSMSNVRMISSLTKKFGPVIEGIRREAAYIDGKYEDLVLFGIIRSEFDEVIPYADDISKMISERDQLRDISKQKIHRYLSKNLDSSIQQLLNKNINV